MPMEKNGRGRGAACGREGVIGSDPGGGFLFEDPAAVTAGDDIVIDAGFEMGAEVEGGADPAAKRTAGFEDRPRLARRHRFDLLDHRRRNDDHPCFQLAAAARPLEMLLLGVPLHPLDRELRVAAGGTGQLI